MPSSAPIGIFDSGIGGLTVMRAIMDLLPSEHVIYFGDTARVPYGNKSPDTIRRYSYESASFLTTLNIKLLVVACNTASAYALDLLTASTSIPVVGVINPAVKKIMSLPTAKNIAVLGTKATIRSEIYQRELAAAISDTTIFPVACPLFVPLVEEGFQDHHAAALIAKEYLSPLKGGIIDTILLGCTHYPFLHHVITDIIGDDVTIVDSAKACASDIRELLDKKRLLNAEKQHGSRHYYVSDDPEHFKNIGERFLGETIDSVSLYNT